MAVTVINFEFEKWFKKSQSLGLNPIRKYIEISLNVRKMIFVTHQISITIEFCLCILCDCTNINFLLNFFDIDKCWGPLVYFEKTFTLGQSFVFVWNLRNSNHITIECLYQIMVLKYRIEKYISRILRKIYFQYCSICLFVKLYFMSAW